jgi:DDE superfamily endonuclease
MDKLKKLMDWGKYHPSLIFNFDETMLYPGKRKMKVLVRAGSAKPVEKIMQKDKHVTFGLCITANGSYVKPLVIFPLKTLPNLPYLALDFFAITGQENGWINAEIYQQWLINIFIPHVRQQRAHLQDPSLRALLIVDGHSSHANDISTALCTQENIDVIVFPAHSSATLQPLDLGVNGAFKAILARHFKVKDNESVDERRARLLAVSVQCLQSALTPLYICEGFSKTGIFPFSREAPLNSELVIDPVDQIDQPRPAKRTRGPRISNQILTYGRPLPTVYLSVEPPSLPQLSPAPATHDSLINPETLMYLH